MIDVPHAGLSTVASSAESPRYRVVLDANVLTSALVNTAGVPGQLVTRLFADEAFEAIVSPMTLDELRRIVTYTRLRPSIHMDDDALAHWIEYFAIVSTVVEDEELPGTPVVKDDPDDDLCLAVATTGRAEYMVSGDRHLLTVGVYGSVTIVTPRQFLQLLDTPFR